MKFRAPHLTRPGLVAALAAIVLAPMLTSPFTATVEAAKSSGCTGGGFKLVNLSTNAVVASGNVTKTIVASSLGASDRFAVRGRYNEFNIRFADFAVLDYAFTGAANPEDLTGGVRTPVWESKVPDLRGITLTSAISVSLSSQNLELSRSGTGASIKITALDCATGGIFQMEPQRGDGTRTRFTHTLAQGAGALTPFYFDNPNFRAHEDEFLGDDCTSVVTGPPSEFCVQVSTRVNLGNDFSKKFVARDSAQVAERVDQTDCNTATPVDPSVNQCGRVSVWDVASGGRVGFVTGEDATEVANPASDCTHKCSAQDRVRGRLANLGFPFAVPAGSRLTPPVSALPLPALTAP
jgi:hypothetical protein